MNLISGKEALIALANDQNVQGNVGYGWVDINPTNESTITVKSFLTGVNKSGIKVDFRLKLHTITLNGIEVPAPFEPKVGEIFYYTSDEHEAGYSHSTLWCEIKNDRWVGMWRTAEEIKQVVAALRKVFKEPQQ
ncbi:hypothetical protein ACNPQK_05575 [Acinetobacter guillouiae]|uniref:hypothetical protein n=1 Tax=Acinetobacter guillouiae TaxID=106649 RepID=UPI003AF74ABD